jgi:hypothetical protein
VCVSHEKIPRASLWHRLLPSTAAPQGPLLLQCDRELPIGDVAIIYSQYLYQVEEDGKPSVTSGRVTEIFVLRDGHWINAGWHTR